MPEFIQMNLSDMISELGEDKVKTILSSFVCPLNEDVQDFIHNKAIEFAKQGWAGTTLVFWRSDDKKEKYLVGYYALASKYICVSKGAVSKSIAKKMNVHGDFNPDSREYIVPASLIGQLGKNFDTGNNLLISGAELLQLALDKIKDIQKEVGGKFVYLECEDKKKLIDFYENNGFTQFGKRKKDRDELGIDGDYLIQLLRYMSNGK